jgi:hypothetical protein
LKLEQLQLAWLEQLKPREQLWLELLFVVVSFLNLT